MRSPFLLTLVPHPDAQRHATPLTLMRSGTQPPHPDAEGHAATASPWLAVPKSSLFASVLDASRKRNSLRTCVQTAPKSSLFASVLHASRERNSLRTCAQTAPKIAAFCIGFCTLQESGTASGLARRPRRNRRFLHRGVHASRKRNSLRTCVNTAPKSSLSAAGTVHPRTQPPQNGSPPAHPASTLPPGAL